MNDSHRFNDAVNDGGGARTVELEEAMVMLGGLRAVEQNKIAFQPL